MSFTGGGGKVYNTGPRRPSKKTSGSGYKGGSYSAMQGGNDVFNADQRNRAATNLRNAGVAPNLANIDAYNNARRVALTSQARNTLPPGNQRMATGPGGGSGRGRGGGGGGGGGGGAAAPTMSQAQLDWLADMLGRGAPKPGVAAKLDLPDLGAFDPAMFNLLDTQLTKAGQTDIGTARGAANTARTNLTANYRNPFAQYTQAQAPGMDQAAMGRLLQGQGVDTSVMAEEAAAMAGANQAFRNVWDMGRINEDLAQGSRLRNVDTRLGDTINAINAAVMGGRTGIGLQRTQAQQDWKTRQQQQAEQEAMANWERGNAVSDQNAQGSAAYRNQVIQTLLGLMPDLYGTTLKLPDLARLGF